MIEKEKVYVKKCMWVLSFSLRRVWSWLFSGLLRTCILVEVHRRFRGGCILHHKGDYHDDGGSMCLKSRYITTRTQRNPRNSHLHSIFWFYLKRWCDFVKIFSLTSNYMTASIVFELCTFACYSVCINLFQFTDCFLFFQAELDVESYSTMWGKTGLDNHVCLHLLHETWMLLRVEDPNWYINIRSLVFYCIHRCLSSLLMLQPKYYSVDALSNTSCTFLISLIGLAIFYLVRQFSKVAEVHQGL